MPSDAPALTALYRELVPNDPNILVKRERIAELATGDSHVLVVERDGAVIATAFLTLCPDPMYGEQPYGVIENVVVTARARGTGAGRALLEHVEHVARTARCTKLMLLSSASRGGAHAFFAALGFDGERKRGFVKYLNR